MLSKVFVNISFKPHAKKLSGSESKKTVNLLYTYKKLILKHLDNRFYYALFMLYVENSS